MQVAQMNDATVSRTWPDRRFNDERRKGSSVDFDPTRAERRGPSDRRFHTMDDKLAAEKKKADERRFTGAGLTDFGGLR